MIVHKNLLGCNLRWLRSEYGPLDWLHCHSVGRILLHICATRADSVTHDNWGTIFANMVGTISLLQARVLLWRSTSLFVSIHVFVTTFSSQKVLIIQRLMHIWRLTIHVLQIELVAACVGAHRIWQPIVCEVIFLRNLLRGLVLNIRLSVLLGLSIFTCVHIVGGSWVAALF